MDTHRFEVNTARHGDHVTVDLIGWMDGSMLPRFRTAMLHLTKHEWMDIVVDCARLDYIDSLSMGALLFWREKFAEQQKAITIANCHGPVLQAFKLAGFHKIFKFV